MIKKQSLRQKSDGFQAWGKIKMLEIYLIKQTRIISLMTLLI